MIIWRFARACAANGRILIWNRPFVLVLVNAFYNGNQYSQYENQPLHFLPTQPLLYISLPIRKLKPGNIEQQAITCQNGCTQCTSTVSAFGDPVKRAAFVARVLPQDIPLQIFPRGKHDNDRKIFIFILFSRRCQS